MFTGHRKAKLEQLNRVIKVQFYVTNKKPNKLTFPRPMAWLSDITAKEVAGVKKATADTIFKDRNTEWFEYLNKQCKWFNNFNNSFIFVTL